MAVFNLLIMPHCLAFSRNSINICSRKKGEDIRAAVIKKSQEGTIREALAIQEPIIVLVNFPSHTGHGYLGSAEVLAHHSMAMLHTFWIHCR